VDKHDSSVWNVVQQAVQQADQQNQKLETRNTQSLTLKNLDIRI